MAYQSGMNLSVNYKIENVSFGVKHLTATGASRFRLNSGGGLRLAQALINSNEIRADGNRSAARNGSRSVTGSYSGDISYGTFDELIEAAHRGTWASDVVTTSNPPTNRSFSFEEVETDLDVSTVYKGCRLAGYTVRLAPDQYAGIEFMVVGADGEVLTGVNSPYFTGTTPSTTEGMTSTDAAISVDGVAALEFSACEFTIDNGAAGVPLVGTNITPDIWPNNNTVSGTITTLRSAVARQQAYLDGIEFALTVLLSDVAGNTLQWDITRCLFTDFTKNLGADGPLMVTMPFTAGYDATATPPSMIYVTRNPIA